MAWMLVFVIVGMKGLRSTTNWKPPNQLPSIDVWTTPSSNLVLAWTVMMYIQDFLHGSSACVNGAGSRSTMQMARLVGLTSRIFLQNDWTKPFLRIFLLPRTVGQAKGMKNLCIRLRFATASGAKVLRFPSKHKVPGSQDCSSFVCLPLYETVSIRSYVPDYGWSSRSVLRD